MTVGSVALQKAVMIPVSDNGDPDFDNAIPVQFNPETLKVTQTNTLETANSGGGQSNAAQFVDSSESSLSVQLVFDTSVGRPEETVTFDAGAGSEPQTSGGARNTASVRAQHEANSDVRILTKQIADKFMMPRARRRNRGRMKAPQKCRFQWGTFAFVGMMSSFDETLDFFAPEGIPLRATLSLSFKQDRYQFENLPGGAADREPPSFSPGGDSVPVAKAAKDAGKPPRDWRNMALFNGIETPRFAGSSGLSIPSETDATAALTRNAPGAAVAGFSDGLSAALGTGLPGAFNAADSLPGRAAAANRPTRAASQPPGRFTSAGAIAANGAIGTPDMPDPTTDFDADTA